MCSLHELLISFWTYFKTFQVRYLLVHDTFYHGGKIPWVRATKLVELHAGVKFAAFFSLRWSKLCYFVIGTFKELRPRLDTMCPYSVHEGNWTCFIGSAFTNRMSLSWSHLRSLQEKTCVQFTWGKLFWNIFFSSYFTWHSPNLFQCKFGSSHVDGQI